MTEAQLSGKRTTEEAVCAVEQPDFTETWHPYAHSVVVDVLSKAMLHEGLVTVKREYSLSEDRTNMFGVWEVKGTETEEVRLAIGFRNSTSKQMAWAIGVGERVFVCSNLIFRAKFIEMHKHTAGLSEEVMVNMARKAIYQIVNTGFEELKVWHEELKGYSLTEEHSSMFMVRALRRRIIRPAKFKKFIELYDSTSYSATLHGLHGAMTEMVRDDKLYINERRNRDISRFIDESKTLLK